jgi:hypothetical protein
MVASGSDNDGTDRYCRMVRVRQARPEGVTTVNQWLTSRQRGAGSHLVERGRYAVRDLHPVGMGSTPKPVDGVGGEATVKVCGVGVAMLPGQSWVAYLVDRFLGERGNHLWLPCLLAGRVGGGQVRGRLWTGGWGGGLVVVRARERRVHGEGDQQVGGEDSGMPGDRR